MEAYMMKRLLFIILCSLMVLLPAFSGGQAEDKQETTTIKWMVWITPNIDLEFYRTVAIAFEAENPGVLVEIVETSATTSATSSDFIRNRLASGDVPDLWMNFQDVPAFADAGHLWEIPAYDTDLKQVKNLMSAAYEGKLYSFPSSAQPQGLMFYNKKLWAESGLTEDDIPYDWNDLNTVCAKIKDAGFTPIAMGGEWVPVLFWDLFMGSELSKEYPDWWSLIYSGEKKWDDPQVLEILEYMDKLVKDGYFMEGALSIGYAQLEQAFLNEQAVMYPMGSWFTAAEASAEKDWECGVFSLPTKDGRVNVTKSGGYGNGFAIYSGSENPELAFKLMKKATLDPVLGAKFLQVDGLYSNLTPPLSYSMSSLQQELADLVTSAEFSRPVMQHPLGDAPPMGIGDYFTSGAEAVLTQSYSSLDDLLKKIDNFVAEVK
ncbi:carbohydrate ABC transporter substrate-binding protein [Oceanispirochaeta sp. M1]|nr:carbohydrate ABC transporter substrate-binding protein [Oceanispirochaeta sp. M1]